MTRVTWLQTNKRRLATGTLKERRDGYVIVVGPRGFAAVPDMLRALKVVCYALAAYRDDEPVNLEELKYNVVDRIIEAIEPGFDGGTTTMEEVRAALTKAEGR